MPVYLRLGLKSAVLVLKALLLVLCHDVCFHQHQSVAAHGSVFRPSQSSGEGGVIFQGDSSSPRRVAAGLQTNSVWPAPLLLFFSALVDHHLWPPQEPETEKWPWHQLAHSDQTEKNHTPSWQRDKHAKHLIG